MKQAIRVMAREYKRTMESDPVFRWLVTGSNVFYVPAAFFLLAPVVSAVQGFTTPMHLYAEITMFALGLVCLLYAGFSQPRSR